MAALTNGREQGKGDGCWPEGAYDVGSSRQLQSKTEQARRGQKKLARGICLVHPWTYEAWTSFSVSACLFCSMLRIPPSVSEEATPQLLHKQPRITIFLHGLTFTWARAATATESLSTFQTSTCFLWLEGSLFLMVWLWTHFISLIKRV